MSVTKSTLSAIQQAGQAINEARQSLAEATKDHAQQVMAAVASQPFSVENDKLYVRWKTIARLAQEVHSIEEQFKTIYQTASGLGGARMPVLTALPHHPSHTTASHQSTFVVDTLAAEDVHVKSSSTPKAPRRTKARKAKRTASPARSLSGNDTKVLNYLSATLNRKSWISVTQGSMADGAGIPRGSIGVALLRLIQAGQVIEGQKGKYKLA